MHIINPMRHALSIAFLISLLAGTVQATTVFVNNTADADAITPGTSPVSTLGDGQVTLRSAIQYFNAANPGANTINFDIPTSDPGYNATTNTWTITPATDLDNIGVPLTIDGYAGAPGGAMANTLAQGDNAKLTIVINGSNYTVGDGQFTGNGLHFVSGSNASLVRGLVINGWVLNGILIDASAGPITGIQINGNFIGTNAAGTAVIANRCGIGFACAVNPDTLALSNPVTGTIIGTSAPANRNIVAGNLGFFLYDGYYIRAACISGMGGVSTSIQNNYIGVDISGANVLGTSFSGIVLELENFLVAGASTIGGALATQANVVSGNSIYGIYLTGQFPTLVPPFPNSGCRNCTIQGNFVGTDISGTLARGNGNAGICIDSNSTNNSIIKNVISGNGSQAGVIVGLFDLASGNGSNSNVVQGNKIGTDVSGTLPLGNTGYGVLVNGNLNTIGGSTAGQGNVISANGKAGIVVYGSSSNTIFGNLIGTDYTGTKPLGNGIGVQLGVLGTTGASAYNNIVGS